VPTKKQIEQADKALDAVDWKKLDALTDAEVEDAAKADPDKELSRAWVVRPLTPPKAAE
jgi:hypothetical protein